MRIVMFYHSLISDWNHGNAHFLRGVTRVLQAQGHQVTVYEPFNGWSLTNLKEHEGRAAVESFRRAFPGLSSVFYDPQTLDLDDALLNADLVIAHEWNTPRFIARLNRHHRSQDSYALLFHDTHHRAVSAPQELDALELDSFDGVLAFGRVIRDLYLKSGWAHRAWTWHEAADTAHYRPQNKEKSGDLIWIGNWGDNERAKELSEFFINPARDLGARTSAFGVRYPDEAIALLRSAGVKYCGWTSAAGVVEQYARHRVTVHVPRRHYAQSLPGIPTIRMFEALACGIPLVSAPWDDTERLFTPGRDFLFARSGDEMREQLQRLLENDEERAELAAHGRATILARHRCEHRVDELMDICEELALDTEPESAPYAEQRP